jgi:thiol-disulfide isomerase/thioredoxin
MKKHFLLLILSVSLLSHSFAQNRKIEFTTEDFTGALAKAKAEKKMIFMDCYTTWCGPCKMLSAQIFTQDAVADYFNANFISVKMDMEKGEGPALQQKYGVKAYPTLLFINPASEEMHRAMGFISAEKLIAAAKKAKDSLWCAACIANRLKKGERSPELIHAYFSGQQENQLLQEGETEAFFASVPDADFTSKAFWSVVRDFGGGINTVSGKRVMALREAFEKNIPSDTLELHLAFIHHFNKMIGGVNINDEKVRLGFFEEQRKVAEALVLKNKAIKKDLLDAYNIEILLTQKQWAAAYALIDGHFESIFSPKMPDIGYHFRVWRWNMSQERTEPEVLIFLEKWMRTAQALKPNEYYSNFALGSTLQRSKKDEEAIKYLEKAIEIGKNDSSVNLQQAQAMLDMLKKNRNLILMGYKIEKDDIIFDFDPKQYEDMVNGQSGEFLKLNGSDIKKVYVAGAMNGWEASATKWELVFNKKTKTYQLKTTKAMIESITKSKKCDFKFVVNGVFWVMPSKMTKNFSLEAGKDFSYANMLLEF